MTAAQPLADAAHEQADSTRINPVISDELRQLAYCKGALEVELTTPLMSLAARVEVLEAEVERLRCQAAHERQ